MLDPETSNALARRLQAGVPLVREPFHELAASLGVPPDAVLKEVDGWQTSGLLREISAVLEGSLLGYESALVAGTIPEDRIDEAAALINEHPTVTHNYRREHRLNLWFTLAVPAEMGLERTAAALASQVGVPTFHVLRRTKTFKIGVNFDLVTRYSQTEVTPLPTSQRGMNPTEVERRMLRALQTPLRCEERPFEELARRAEVSEGALLDLARSLVGGVLRRYVATFWHRRVGVHGNGMVVWRAEPEEEESVGTNLAAAREVSHCYARQAAPGFPYTVYSMIHGPDEESVRGVARRLEQEVGPREHLILFSTREYKKARLRYFLPELDAWWARHGRPTS
jgi:DNA-binding Lrp family transcriptional regulator